VCIRVHSPGHPGDRDACSYLAHFSVAALDVELHTHYRERMFRHSALVPAGVRIPLTAYTPSCADNCVFVTLSGVDSLAAAVQRVAKESASVVLVTHLPTAILDLSLRSLPNADASLMSFESKLERAIRPSSPRQYSNL
jgi:hypothetical protein